MQGFDGERQILQKLLIAPVNRHLIGAKRRITRDKCPPPIVQTPFKNLDPGCLTFARPLPKYPARLGTHGL
mgnify:CR=1 FL=1